MNVTNRDIAMAKVGIKRVITSMLKHNSSEYQLLKNTVSKCEICDNFPCYSQDRFKKCWNKSLKHRIRIRHLEKEYSANADSIISSNKDIVELKVVINKLNNKLSNNETSK